MRIHNAVMLTVAAVMWGCTEKATAPEDEGTPPRLTSCAALADEGWNEIDYRIGTKAPSGLPCMSEDHWDGVDLAGCLEGDQDRRYLALRDDRYVWGWDGGTNALVAYRRCMEKEVGR